MINNSILKEKIPVALNSKTRTTPSPIERMYFTFDSSIERVLEIEVENVSIPFSYYIVNSGNNSIRFANGDSATITAGSYTPANLASTIQSTVRASTSYTSFTCTYDTVSYTFTLANPSTFGIYVNESAYANSSIAQSIGFSVSKSGSTSYASEVPISDQIITLAGANNQLIISVGLTDYTVTLTNGNYDGYSMATEIQTQINATALDSYSCSYSRTTLKFTITHASDNFTVKGATSSAGTILGFTYNQAAVSNGSAMAATSNNAVSLSGPNLVYIRSNTIAQLKFSKSVADTKVNENIIYSVLVQAAPGDYITEMPQKPRPIRLSKNATISSIDLSITDADNRILNLNGLDWSITLSFNIYWKQLVIFK